MLELVNSESEKHKLQVSLQSAFRNTLAHQGVRKVGNPGGTDDLEIFSNGRGELWYGHQIAPTRHDEKSGRAKHATKRHWNAFGLFNPHTEPQSIIVEINIPIDSNSGNVAGFFARDVHTGTSYLMHSGKVGGGRKGIGKKAFLQRSNYQLDEVRTPTGLREGIRIGCVDSPSIVREVEAFVSRVKAFKVFVAE